MNNNILLSFKTITPTPKPGFTKSPQDNYIIRKKAVQQWLSPIFII